MDKNRKLFKKAFILLATCASLFLNTVPVFSASVRLSSTKITIMKNESITLKVVGSKKKPKWSSSDKKIAKVSNKGIVTGKKAGKATIKCVVAGKSLKCSVTVKAKTANNSDNSNKDSNSNKSNKKDCPVCGGLGDCGYCYGLGECETCFGNGTVACSTCGGSGNCTSCYGTKGEYKYTVGGKKWVQCSRCSGSGNCTKCNGQGDVRCTRCSGSGKCTYCNGNVTCNYCGGKGYVIDTGEGTNGTDDNTSKKPAPNDNTPKEPEPDDNTPGNNSSDDKTEASIESANLATVTIDGVKTTFYLYSAYISAENYLCVSFYTLEPNGKDKGCLLKLQLENNKVYTGSTLSAVKKSGLNYEDAEMGMSIFGSTSYTSLYGDCKTKQSGNYNITFDSVDGKTYKGTFNGVLFHKSCNYAYSYRGTDFKTFEDGTFEFTLDQKNSVFS